MSALRVSIPLGGLNASGGMKNLVFVANAAAAQGWAVRLVVPDYAAESPFALAPGVRVERLRTPALPGLARAVAYYLRLALSAARDTDVCLANFWVTAYCAMASRLLHRRARVVYFVLGFEPLSHGTLAEAGWLSRRLRRRLATWSYRLPVRVICISHWLRGQIRRDDARVVPLALDLSIFRPASTPRPNAPVVVGTVGIPGRAKGYPVFLRALEETPGLEDVVVAVAAPRPVPLPAGRAARQRACRSEQEMAAFYHGCDVFVFSSLAEGFGLPPLEAMACGCAVVTTDCGGVREFARDGVNCLVVPPEDPAALGAAVRTLVADAALRARLAAAGVVTAQRFERGGMLRTMLEALAS